MEVQIALGASRSERDSLFERLAKRGFIVSNQERRKNGSIKMSKEYADAVTGEFRARVNLTAIDINDAGKSFEYSLYVETHAHDSVTGENVAEGNSMEMATQQQYRMEKFVLFIDSALMAPACTQFIPLPTAEVTRDSSD
jgi:hypothetical protein